jgi:hypothetical protein
VNDIHNEVNDMGNGVNDMESKVNFKVKMDLMESYQRWSLIKIVPRFTGNRVGIKSVLHNPKIVMKLISTRVHGYLDYIVGAILIICPWVLGFARGGAETWVFVAQGALSILYSVLTNYEPGIFRVLSMRMHLLLDLISAFLLAFSPWIFGFSGDIWVPHVVFGVMELLVVALSVSVSGTEVKQKKFSGLRPVH